MANTPISEGPRGVSATGDGLECSVAWGEVGARTRGDGQTVDPIAAAIDATDGFEIVAGGRLDVQVLPTVSRGGQSEASLVVQLGVPTPDERRVVLIEENGRYTWSLPAEGQEHVAVPVEASPGSRGFFTNAVNRVIRVIAVKALGPLVQSGTRTLVGGWDQSHHPYRLRTWTPENHAAPDAPSPDFDLVRRDRALLVIHGFTGSIHGSFGSLAADVVAGFGQAYGGRVFAFDHPTLVETPQSNARWVLDNLPAASVPLDVDILAHSRGGLVARELAADSSGRLAVGSITFVATPNDGTPLADPRRPEGLLDALTNLAGIVPGNEVVQLALQLLNDVVFKRSLESLAGLLAMEHGGSYLSTLNRDALPGTELRAIVADFEPRTDAGFVRTARNRLLDMYFGGVRNDLVVPTLSTIVTDGAFRVRPDNRLVLDSSRGVDHSTFWTNPRATRQLLDWLRPDTREHPPPAVSTTENEPKAEVAVPPSSATLGSVIDRLVELPASARDAVSTLVGGPIDPNARPPDGSRPAVVVLPGIMGTHLQRVGGDLIWIDPVRLARGHFSDLAWNGGPGGIEAAGLNRGYLPLITRLATQRDVYLAPYDWRADIADSAQQLAEFLRAELLESNPTRPVHLVAHSMGGLVARALAYVAPDVWAELGNDDRGASGRLVMLGTPNRGSYSIVLTLLGAEAILKVVSGIDIHSDVSEIVRVVASFPGVYQMLPAVGAAPTDDAHAELYQAAAWGANTPVRQELLDRARHFHESMAEVHDPDRLVCVLGEGHPTPFRVGFDDTGAITLGRFTQGDGRVAFQLGALEGVTTYYTDATHGGLASDTLVLDEIDNLLDAGTCSDASGLRTEPTVRRGGEALTIPPMVPADAFDEVPSAGIRGVGTTSEWRGAEHELDDALRATVGGGARVETRAVVSVHVLHASLEQAKHPVAVGHYAGLPMDGAERFLDTRLGGALGEHHRLHRYPELEGTAIYVGAPPGHRPRGAFVLGLGEFGALTPATLSAAIAQATIARVLDDPSGATPGISATLVGTPGRHGLSVETSVVALVEGVIDALEQLGEARTGEPPAEVELELVELYAQPAEEAAVAVRRLEFLLDPARLERISLRPADELLEGDGRQPGVQPRDSSGTPWVRVLVELADGDDGPELQHGSSDASTIRTMTFSTLTRGAQTNVIRRDIDLAKIRGYVDAAVRASDGAATSRTLYESLFPRRAKLDLDRSESLHLLVDDAMAEVPWELMAAESIGRDAGPLALRAGMLRQLVSKRDHTPERVQHPTGLVALVVGDPPTKVLPRLHGARLEATHVSSLFRASGWDVVERIYDDSATGDADEWMDIVNVVTEHPYRVMHIAAHGILDDEDPRRTGVVIGPEPHQRITALEFEGMTVTPDLVFLNCCHLGRLTPERTGLSPEALVPYSQPHRVAATVAQQLLRNGVGAVVVAGWEVDDNAAEQFAARLYSCMLDGSPFGEAVRYARVAAHAADGGLSNTWGAYQCYGDPAFELVADSRSSSRKLPVVSASQLERGLTLAATRAGDATSDAHVIEVLRDVEGLRDEGRRFLGDGRVVEALGNALAELGRYPEAAEAYRQALADKKGTARVRAVEQLANMEARHAARLARIDRSGNAAAVAERFAEAERLLTAVDALVGPSAERLALHGGVWKRRAVTANGEERADALNEARDAYRRAWDLSSDGEPAYDSYHTTVWLQLETLINGSLTEEQLAILTRLHAERGASASATKYWDVAALADTLLTFWLTGTPPPDGSPLTIGSVSAEYGKAFDLRSTVRQRDSVLEHLGDLGALAPTEVGAELRTCVSTLSTAH